MVTKKTLPRGVGYVFPAMEDREAKPSIRTSSGHPQPDIERYGLMKKLLLASTAALIATSAWADYPERPVTIIVPFAAGGPTDKVARDFGEAVRKQLNNVTIVIDNVGGAGGTLGAAKTSKAA